MYTLKIMENSLKKIREFLDSIESYECPEIAFYQWWLGICQYLSEIEFPSASGWETPMSQFYGISDTVIDDIQSAIAEINDEEKQAMECMKND